MKEKIETFLVESKVTFYKENEKFYFYGKRNFKFEVSFPMGDWIQLAQILPDGKVWKRGARLIVEDFTHLLQSYI